MKSHTQLFLIVNQAYSVAVASLVLSKCFVNSILCIRLSNTHNMLTKSHRRVKPCTSGAPSKISDTITITPEIMLLLLLLLLLVVVHYVKQVLFK